MVLQKKNVIKSFIYYIKSILYNNISTLAVQDTLVSNLYLAVTPVCWLWIERVCILKRVHLYVERCPLYSLLWTELRAVRKLVRICLSYDIINIINN